MIPLIFPIYRYFLKTLFFLFFSSIFTNISFANIRSKQFASEQKYQSHKLFHKSTNIANTTLETRTLRVASNIPTQPQKSTPTTTEEKKELIVYSSMDLSRYYSKESQLIKEGVEMAFAQANEQKELGNTTLTFLAYDHENDPVKAREIAKKITEEKGLPIILAAMNVATFQSYMEYISTGKLLMLFPMSSSPLHRDITIKYFILFRVGGGQELDTLLKYARDTLKSQKYAIFFERMVSDEIMKGYLSKIFQIDLQKTLLAGFDRRDVTFDTQANEIKQFNPDTIIFLSTTIAAQSLIRQLGLDFFAEKKLLGMSGLSIQLFRAFSKREGLNFIFSSVVPNPDSQQYPIAVEFSKQCEKNSLETDTNRFQGYIDGRLLVDALKKIEKPWTIERISHYFEALNNYDFGGINLTFDPKKKQLCHYIWLDTGEKEWTQIQGTKMTLEALRTTT